MLICVEKPPNQLGSPNSWAVLLSIHLCGTWGTREPGSGHAGSCIPPPGTASPETWEVLAWMAQASLGLLRDWQGRCQVKSSGEGVSWHSCSKHLPRASKAFFPWMLSGGPDQIIYTPFFPYANLSPGSDFQGERTPPKRCFPLGKQKTGSFEPAFPLGQPWALSSCPPCGAGASLHPCATESCVAHGNGKATGTPHPRHSPYGVQSCSAVVLSQRQEGEKGWKPVWAEGSKGSQGVVSASHRLPLSPPHSCLP